jgi:DNA-binding beta-propeller fold protein YncE
MNRTTLFGAFHRGRLRHSTWSSADPPTGARRLDVQRADTTGGGQAPTTIAVGNGPYPIDVDQRTGAVYVGSAGDGTISLIDGNSVNARPPRLLASRCGSSRGAVAVRDRSGPASDALYITSIVDNDVARIDGQACTPTNIRDCRPDQIPLRMGGWGGTIAVDASSWTAYVPDNDDGTVSIYAGAPMTGAPRS